jgi:hypothetical protein
MIWFPDPSPTEACSGVRFDVLAVPLSSLVRLRFLRLPVHDSDPSRGLALCLAAMLRQIPSLCDAVLSYRSISVFECAELHAQLLQTLSEFAPDRFTQLAAQCKSVINITGI